MIHLMIFIVIVQLFLDKKHGDNSVLSVVWMLNTVLLTMLTVTGLDQFHQEVKVNYNVKLMLL